MSYLDRVDAMWQDYCSQVGWAGWLIQLPGLDLGPFAPCSVSDQGYSAQLTADCTLHHCPQMLMIRQIFLYLDRTHVIATTATRSLFDMGLALLRKHLAQHPTVSE